MTRNIEEDRSLFTLLAGDGRPLLSLTTIVLLGSGLFAIFLAARREFLPHDVAYLGMDAHQLCRFSDCPTDGLRAAGTNSGMAPEFQFRKWYLTFRNRPVIVSSAGTTNLF